MAAPALRKVSVMPSRSIRSDSPFQPSRRALLTTAAAGAALTGISGASSARAAAAKKASPPRHVSFTSWSDDDLSFGAFDRTIDYVDPHGTSGTPVTS